MIDTSAALRQFHLDQVHPGTYAAGEGWAPVEGRALLEHVCPADGEVTGRVALSTPADYERVIATALETQRRWRQVPAPRRGELVRRIGELVAQNLDALAAVVCLDTGKSVMEAKGELQEVVDMANLAAGQSRMLYGFTQQSQRPEHRMYDQWLPLGVVGVISAYNFPAAVWAQNGFLAAIGGNAVIWKPSPKVPLTALALQRLANLAAAELGAEGVFSLWLPDDADAALLVEDTRVDLVSFTGSTRVGTWVADVVGKTLGRRHLLECSGNNGCIVDETADLALAAKAITFGAVGTTGQRCTSTRRVIVHESVADELVALLVRAFDQVRIGDFRDPDTLVGPLIDQAAVELYRAAIARAVEQGGTVVYGGNVLDRPGRYVEPCLITGVEPDFDIAQEETFAPIVSVLTYRTLDEAIAIHNGVAQGLASGMHSTSLTNIERFLSAAGSDCGIVRINMGTTGADVGAAFGGEKETGGGRTAGSDSWKGYMRRQSVCVNWGGASAWDARIELGGGAGMTSPQKVRHVSPDVREPAPELWSNCVRVGDQVWVSGMTARAADGETVVGEEYEQTLVVLGKIRALVEAAGGVMDDVVKMTIYVTRMARNTEVWRARREFFTGDFPACTLVEVAALAKPEILLEIEATAVVGCSAH